MLPETDMNSTTRSRHKGGHKDYNRAIEFLINEIDKKFKQ